MYKDETALIRFSHATSFLLAVETTLCLCLLVPSFGQAILQGLDRAIDVVALRVSLRRS
jgi:hypothetical protein